MRCRRIPDRTIWRLPMPPRGLLLSDDYPTVLSCRDFRIYVLDNIVAFNAVKESLRLPCYFAAG